MKSERSIAKEQWLLLRFFSDDWLTMELTPVLENLDVLDDCRAEIPEWAKSIDSACMFGLSSYRNTNPAAARKEIERLKQLCLKLFGHIHSLSYPANAAFRDFERKENPSRNDGKVYVLDDLARNLFSAIDIASAAIETQNMSDFDFDPQEVLGVARKGKLITKAPDIQAIAVTMQAVRAFEGLTGKAANVWNDSNDQPSGPFLKFLGEVFEVCRIDKKPISYAKLVRSWRKENVV